MLKNEKQKIIIYTTIGFNNDSLFQVISCTALNVGHNQNKNFIESNYILILFLW
jgi:hypothetical protein